MVWSRDTNITVPQTWRKFQAKSKTSDEILNFRIQDATVDLIPAIVECMLHLIQEEPVARCFEIANDPETIQHVTTFYGYLVTTGTVLVCLKENEDGSTELVGCNMTLVSEPGDDFSAVANTPKLKGYISIFDHIDKKLDIYSKFGVSHCLKAAGLSVVPKYRGLGIATELLNARTEFCKALKIPLTATEFTSPGGQASARKSGFIWIRDSYYADIMKEIPGLPLEEITHPFTSLMYKKFE